MRHFLVMIICALLVPGPAGAREENVNIIRDKTEARLREIVQSSSGAMGVVAVDLTSGERLAVNDTLAFPQASAIKVAVLMEVFKQAHEGRLDLSEPRRIATADKAGGSGILGDLGDGTVEMSLRDLCVLMIVLSDNTATNILIDRVGMENINRTLAALGLEHTRVRRRMMDTAASLRGDENLSTPAEAARIMELLHTGAFVDRAVCEAVLSILLKTKGGSIRAALPADVPVAFKPGGIPGVSTEWALVRLKERPYVVVVMENYGLESGAASAMTQVSQVLHDYYRRLGRATAHGTYVDRPPAP